MPAPTTLPERLRPLLDLGAACRHCGAVDPHIVYEDHGGGRLARVECGSCGSFGRWLRPDEIRTEAAPPPSRPSARPPWSTPTCRWLGWVQPHGGKWLPVADADSLEAAWDALLTVPLDGARMVFPVEP